MNNSQVFEIQIVNHNQWESCGGKHNYYELVFVFKGQGNHYLNKQEISYKKDDLFIFSPGTCHSSIAATETQFCLIRFSEVFFRNTQKHGLHGHEDWFKRLEKIFCSFNGLPASVIESKHEKTQVRSLIKALLLENEREGDINSMSVTHHLLYALMDVLERSILNKISCVSESNLTPEKILQIINYIHSNIYFPEKLSVAMISSEFNLSSTYLNEYFKKHIGKSIKYYISEYKMKLIKYKLEFSDASISELSYLFNFTDESHLNKSFKKAYGFNPSELKK